MRKFQKRLLILIATGVIGILIAAVLLFSYIPDRFRNKTVSQAFSSKELMKAAIQRDLFYGLQTDDFTRLEESARRAAHKRRGSEDFWAALVFAEMKLGNIEDASAIGKKHLSSTEYKALLSQLHLISETINTGEEKGSREDLILSEYNTRDPMVYERIARMLPDPRLVINAALLWAGSGDPGKAYFLLKDRLPSSKYSKLLVYFAIDAGEFNNALITINSLRSRNNVYDAELSLLEADALMWLGMMGKAASIYTAFIENNPSFSLIPSLNLAWMASETGNYTEAIMYLDGAFRFFSGDRGLFIPKISYLYQEGKYDEAMIELSKFLNTHPMDKEGMLFALVMPKTIKNHVRHETTLWSLLNKNPEDDLIGRYFAAYSFMEKNYEDLEIILSRFVSYPDSAGWVAFFKGCSAATRGNLDSGIAFFRSSLDEKELWETHFNLALLYSSYRDFAKSLNQLQQADHCLLSSGKGNILPARSVIRTEIARILSSQENYTGAVRELLFALDLDPTNYNARLMLKKMEGR